MIKNKTGFTMVELLIVMGVMGILVSVLSQVFGSILTMKLRSEATTAVAQDSRYLIARLTYDVSRAHAISVPNSTTLNLTIGGISYIYSLIGNTLNLSVAGGQSMALTSTQTKINSLVFTKLPDIKSTQSVQISYNISPTIIQPGGVSGARQLTTTVATK